MSKNEIHGEQHPVRKVFSDDFAFVVPAYQRPYAWKRDHADGLLEDLLTFLGTGAEPVEDISPYFLGSIVLIKGDTPRAEIVDGQQRLATLTILLSVLRDLLPAGDDLTPFIAERRNAFVLNAADRYRLTLRERDAGFFRQYIQDRGGIARLATLNAATLSDSQRNVFDNTLYFRGALSDLREESPERLDRLARYILNRCFLVLVSTPDLDSAYRIFSVLNGRGLDLSYTDILKAQIIGPIPAAAHTEYTAKWEDTEESLGREHFEALLGHIRMIYRKQKLGSSILKEFREYVIPAVPDSQHLIDDVILPYAEAADTIRHADYQSTHGAGAVNHELSWLNRIPDSDWIPPAVLYLAQRHNDPDALVRFFRDLERLAVFLQLTRASVNKRIERHGNLLRAIENGDDLFAADSPLQLTPAESAAMLRALNSDIYNQAAAIRKYVLLRLDTRLAGTEAIYSWDKVTVEHVLPQNPPANSEWTRWFPNSDVRERWVHRVANLVLLSRAKNSKAANFDFAKKKKTYFAAKDGVSPFALTMQVLQRQSWTPSILGTQQQQYLEQLKQLWRLDTAQPALPPQPQPATVPASNTPTRASDSASPTAL